MAIFRPKRIDDIKNINHLSFIFCEEYAKRSDECFAYCETELSTLPFTADNADNAGEVEWLAKNKSGDFEPMEYCRITAGGK